MRESTCMFSVSTTHNLLVTWATSPCHTASCRVAFVLEKQLFERSGSCNLTIKFRIYGPVGKECQWKLWVFLLESKYLLWVITLSWDVPVSSLQLDVIFQIAWCGNCWQMHSVGFLTTVLLKSLSSFSLFPFFGFKFIHFPVCFLFSSLTQCWNSLLATTSANC